MNLHGIQQAAPPNTNKYVSLEIFGVVDRHYDDPRWDGETYCETIDPHSGEKPHFFSVYGRAWVGDFLEADLIDDYPTREEARAAAAQMGLSWAIPIDDLANWETP